MNNSNSALKILKPIISLVGFISVLVSFVKVDVLFYDSGYMSVFKLISSLSALDLFDSDEIQGAKIIIIAIAAVISLFAIIAGLTSLIENAAGKVVPIVFSVLNIICAVLVIAFCVAVNSDEDLYGLAAINPGLGFYILIITSIAVIIMSAVTKTKKAINQPQLQNYPYANNPYPNNQYQNNPYPSPDYPNQMQNPTVKENYGYKPPVDNSPLTRKTATNNTASGTISGISGEYAGFEFPILNGEILHIGKDASNNAIVITENNDLVSRNHCAVKFENNAYFVMDYSTNGTIVNGSAINKNVWIPIVIGSKICLYDERNMFTIG